MRRLNQEAVEFLDLLDKIEAEGSPSASSFLKIAKDGHWRNLPSHHKGEDEGGQEVYGKTWVDRKERSKGKQEISKEEVSLWTEEEFEKEKKQVVFLGFDSNEDAVMYGRPTSKGTLVFHMSLAGGFLMEEALKGGHKLKSDIVNELFEVLE